jgi:hypothetical protein
MWVSGRVRFGATPRIVCKRWALRLLLVGHDAKSSANMLGLSVYPFNDWLRMRGASLASEAAVKQLGGVLRWIEMLPISLAPKKLATAKPLFLWK